MLKEEVSPLRGGHLISRSRGWASACSHRRCPVFGSLATTNAPQSDARLEAMKEFLAEGTDPPKMEAAGPREKLFFPPSPLAFNRDLLWARLYLEM